ncbi:MAG: hypothetical protein R2724_34590 [Bryobacterales bacterium]
MSVVLPSQADELEQSFALNGSLLDPYLNKFANELQERAQLSAETWGQLSQGAFEPECLTIYLSNRCNLQCSYCYAAQNGKRDLISIQKRVPGEGSNEAFPVINEEVVGAAANVVAANCVNKGKPFTLVLHGGGEPTLHWATIQRLASITKRIARSRNIKWWSYLATHGAISDDKAQWLARNINLIGLSCDGPPDIQNTQRPKHDGVPTSELLKHTAKVFLSFGAKFVVRATITPITVYRQSEIVTYICQELGAKEIRFEPVYFTEGSHKVGFKPADAEVFVSHFLDAEKRARELGSELKMSGVRLDEIHGPYCNILRDVLHLTPDGSATACFLSTDGREPGTASMTIGQLESPGGNFRLHEERITAFRHQATRIPARCHDCVNVYHCVRECPEVCPVVDQEEDSRKEGGFRCRVQKQLAEHWILQAN